MSAWRKVAAYHAPRPTPKAPGPRPQAPSPMQAVLRDIRYGVRSLAKAPALALVATLALTLGIGVTAVMFSIIYGALMKGLPFDEGDRIVQLVRANPTNGSNGMGTPISDFVDYRDQQKTMSSLSAYYTGTVNVSGEVEAERFSGAFVTASALELTRVRPFLGRTFQPGEDSPSVRAWRSSDTACGSVASGATRRSWGRRSAPMASRTRSSASCP